MGLWDFMTSVAENGDALVLGSNDFDYYHHLELEFHGVMFNDLPATFSHAQFRLDRRASDRLLVWITAVPPDDIGEREFEVQATTMTARIGTVYYYDRQDLKPGERIDLKRQ